MKSDKVDSVTKVVPKLIPLTTETYSLVEKKKTAHAAEICALLKPSLLKDMNSCAKFVDGVKGVICLSSFAKHTTENRMTTLLAMM
ncbi:hypothetical protein ACFXTO_019181 [Malus domestica]